MKPTNGQKMADRLKEFADALESGEVISEKFTCRKFLLDFDRTPYDEALVKKTRKIVGASQAVFAQFLGVSVQTVRAWEQGINTPNDMACRFMDEIRLDPRHWRSRLKKAIVGKKEDVKRLSKAK